MFIFHVVVACMMRLPTTSRFLVDLNVNVCKLLPVCYSFSSGFVGKIQLSNRSEGFLPKHRQIGINRQAMNSTEATLKWSTSVMRHFWGCQVSSEGWYLDHPWSHFTWDLGWRIWNPIQGGWLAGFLLRMKKVVGKPRIFERIFCVDPSSGTQNLLKVLV